MSLATTPKRILITGVSSGFGRALAECAAAAGHSVVGTARSESDANALEAALGPNARVAILDVTDFGKCGPVVDRIEAEFGPIDVLVNNAGYGHEGIIEESPLEELRAQFDVNVFGAVAMIKAVVPYMRARRCGHIINITSMGGYVSFPGVAYYCGSKFALEGISGSLALELRGVGIKVTAVAPGGFRTDWAGRSMRRSARTIADYDAFFEPIRSTRLERHGRQTGDPRKAAVAILDIACADEPPTHLLLGSDALDLVQRTREAEVLSIAQWATTSRSTDAAPDA